MTKQDAKSFVGEIFIFIDAKTTKASIGGWANVYDSIPWRAGAFANRVGRRYGASAEVRVKVARWIRTEVQTHARYMLGFVEHPQVEYGHVQEAYEAAMRAMDLEDDICRIA